MKEDEDTIIIYNHLQNKGEKFELQIKIQTENLLIDASKNSREIKYIQEEQFLRLIFPIILRKTE